jgi:hypothetical protein
MKAILITEANRPQLAQRWNVEESDWDDVLPLGYWLVADFGNNSIADMPFETLTQSFFTTTFGVGPFTELENGWIEVA